MRSLRDLADQRRQFVHDPVGDVVLRARPVRRGARRRRAIGGREFLVADHALLAHGRQHQPRTLFRRLGSRAGESRDGALSSPASSAASARLTSRARLAEITPRGGFDAKGTGAEIDPVEIHLEDLILAVFVLEPQGQKHLLDLSLERPIGF